MDCTINKNSESKTYFSLITSQEQGLDECLSIASSIFLYLEIVDINAECHVKFVKYLTGINYICELYEKLRIECDQQARLIKDNIIDKSNKQSPSKLETGMKSS